MVDQFATLRNADGLHGVPQHLDALATLRGRCIVGGIAGYALEGCVGLQLCADILEYGQSARGGIHQSLPLAAGQPVVTRGQRLNLLVGATALHGVAQYLAVHGRCSMDGVEHVGEVGLVQSLRHQAGVCLRSGFKAAEVGQPLAGFAQRQLGLADGRLAAGIFLLVQLHLRPTHEFRLALAAEAVVFVQDGSQLAACRGAELRAEPLFQMLSDGLGPDAVDVPRHVKEQLQVVGGHLGVVDVGNPQPSGVMVVGRAHLVIDKAGLRGGQPEVVVGPSPVRQVVVDAGTALPLLLLRVRQARHVAVVVVAPHQHDVVRHAQAALHDFQYLFIGYKDLGHALHVLAIVFAYQLALVVDDLLQSAELLFAGLDALHRTVVNAAHADGEELLGAAHLLQSLGPVLPDLLAVGHVVIGTAHVAVPLGHVVAQQRFAMAAANEDAAGVGHLLVAPDGEEARRTLVHGRPEGIGAKPQQQLENGLVGLGAYDTLAGPLVVFLCPAAQAPVLVVDEDAAIGHRWRMLHLL